MQEGKQKTTSIDTCGVFLVDSNVNGNVTSNIYYCAGNPLTAPHRSLCEADYSYSPVFSELKERLKQRYKKQAPDADIYPVKQWTRIDQGEHTQFGTDCHSRSPNFFPPGEGIYRASTEPKIREAQSTYCHRLTHAWVKGTYEKKLFFWVRFEDFEKYTGELHLINFLADTCLRLPGRKLKEKENLLAKLEWLFDQYSHNCLLLLDGFNLNNILQPQPQGSKSELLIALRSQPNILIEQKSELLIALGSQLNILIEQKSKLLIALGSQPNILIEQRQVWWDQLIWKLRPLYLLPPCLTDILIDIYHGVQSVPVMQSRLCHVISEIEDKKPIDLASLFNATSARVYSVIPVPNDTGPTLVVSMVSDNNTQFTLVHIDPERWEILNNVTFSDSNCTSGDISTFPIHILPNKTIVGVAGKKFVTWDIHSHQSSFPMSSDIPGLSVNCDQPYTIAPLSKTDDTLFLFGAHGKVAVFNPIENRMTRSIDTEVKNAIIRAIGVFDDKKFVVAGGYVEPGKHEPELTRWHCSAVDQGACHYDAKDISLPEDTLDFAESVLILNKTHFATIGYDPKSLTIKNTASGGNVLVCNIETTSCVFVRRQEGSTNDQGIFSLTRLSSNIILSGSKTDVYAWYIDSDSNWTLITPQKSRCLFPGDHNMVRGRFAALANDTFVTGTQGKVRIFQLLPENTHSENEQPLALPGSQDKLCSRFLSGVIAGGIRAGIFKTISAMWVRRDSKPRNIMFLYLGVGFLLNSAQRWYMKESDSDKIIKHFLFGGVLDTGLSAAVATGSQWCISKCYNPGSQSILRKITNFVAMYSGTILTGIVSLALEVYKNESLSEGIQAIATSFCSSILGSWGVGNLFDYLFGRSGSDSSTAGSDDTQQSANASMLKHSQASEKHEETSEDTGKGEFYGSPIGFAYEADVETEEDEEEDRIPREAPG